MDSRLALIYDNVNVMFEELAIARIGDKKYLINIDTAEVIIADAIRMLKVGDSIVVDYGGTNGIYGIIYGKIIGKNKFMVKRSVNTDPEREIESKLDIIASQDLNKDTHSVEIYNKYSGELYKRYEGNSINGLPNARYTSIKGKFDGKTRKRDKIEWITVKYKDNEVFKKDIYKIDANGELSIVTVEDED